MENLLHHSPTHPPHHPPHFIEDTESPAPVRPPQSLSLVLGSSKLRVSLARSLSQLPRDTHRRATPRRDVIWLDRAEEQQLYHGSVCPARGCARADSGTGRVITSFCPRSGEHVSGLQEVRCRGLPALPSCKILTLKRLCVFFFFFFLAKSHLF